MKIKVTNAQADRIAARLFPDDAGVAVRAKNCMSEVGREGQRCRICDENKKRWRGVVRAVRKSIEIELNIT